MDPRFGYVLCSEEHSPDQLLAHALAAEEHGFAFAFLSDHFHPWNERQGHSAFVWSLLGALSQVTHRLEFINAVTCPFYRVHPVAVAQAAATTGLLMKGRFSLGLGTGENLNEHVVGRGWPPFEQRLAMLEEAFEILRLLFRGGQVSFEGRHFKMDQARLYDLPPRAPSLLMAASGPKAARTAARHADGLIALGPAVLEAYQASGTRYGQLSLCWAEDEPSAVETVQHYWPEMALEGALYTRLKTPADFERACGSVSAEDLRAAVVCGPDPERHAEAVREYLAAGFERVALHQIGPRQGEFMRFFREQVWPRL